jgi:hypothetical protein
VRSQGGPQVGAAVDETGDDPRLLRRPSPRLPPPSLEPLYFNDAEMTALHPGSMICSGQRMNITVTRYAAFLTLGTVGDHTSLRACNAG